MSNQAVGGLYHSIIDEVINSSRVDFEEGGVDESVLEELRRGWQLKLSQLGVASFPWDPKAEQPTAPQAAPAPSVPASLPSAAPAQTQYSQAQLTPQMTSGGMALPNGEPQVKPEPVLMVKTEPGLPAPAMAAPQYGATRANEAALRAQQNLQASYGSRATNSINAINAGIGTSRPQGPGQPGNPAQFRPGQMPQGVPNVQAAQTDGAGEDDFDYEGVLMQRTAAGTLEEMGRVEIDRVLHAQMAARAKAMEGGGLMLPLKEATRRRAVPMPQASAAGPSGVSNLDGGLDDDEVDEDAINSDLDDPDEKDSDDDDDDEALQHVMLCMYDKVQRVKNKWKCILKDGVLTVNGKEYVFHKATGEYEW